MNFIKLLIPYLDDIFLILGLITIITASYFINAILGTYILGIAFLLAAFLIGEWFRRPAIQQIMNKFKRKR